MRVLLVLSGWFCHGVWLVGFVMGILLVLSSGCCWFCLEGFVGFALRAPLGLSCLFFVFFSWFCRESFCWFFHGGYVGCVMRAFLVLS